LLARIGVVTEKSEHSNEGCVIIGKGFDVERKGREGEKRFSLCTKKRDGGKEDICSVVTEGESRNSVHW
jgi:hypothetical protein